MKTSSILFSMLKADFQERTRRGSFLVTVCLILYLGYAVNVGTILIKLDGYRGVYNSAWVGGLMTLVITFFLGVAGFYLVKNTIERDEQTGVGQIIATTPLTRPQYLLGKWLSNFAVLSALVGILALAAILMQIIQREVAEINIWALVAPLLFVALPMMALVAAFAVFFESVHWLKGGFGNLAYFGVFMALFMAGVFLTDFPWLDVTGVSLIGPSMKAAAKTAIPGYTGSFVLAMISDKALQTFVWNGIDWSLGLILQRLGWLAVSIGVVLLGTPFFNRFDPSGRILRKPVRKAESAADLEPQVETHPRTNEFQATRLTPLTGGKRFRFNILRLVWLEVLLLVKGLKWYWWAGMAVIWLGCVFSPSDGYRLIGFMLAALWPVLVWSKMGAREAGCHTGQLVYQAAYPLIRLTLPAWAAGVLVTALLSGGVLLGRALSGEALHLIPWLLAVLFIPTLALLLGNWSRGSKLFEVVYPIWWYLGPFNRENGLAGIDYLGIHSAAYVNTMPLLVAGALALMLALAILGKRQQMDL